MPEIEKFDFKYEESDENKAQVFFAINEAGEVGAMVSNIDKMLQLVKPIKIEILEEQGIQEGMNYHANRNKITSKL